jgi:SAM-dependent methyltransferase
MQAPAETLDYLAITDRQRQTWSTGDFHQIARQLVTISEDVVRRADPRPGQRVLDVACGSGNTALVAARRYCEVTGIDFVPSLIEQARRRAATDGVDADFIVGDAQDLPFPDASFDVVLSVMGVMFAPDQDRAAAELLRVCKPGGTIGIAAWPPDGSIADFFRVHAAYGEPPPDGLRPPFRWGTREGLQKLLGHGAHSLHTERRTTTMYYRSPEHAVEVLRTYFGPTMLALAELDEADQRSLRDNLVALHRANNKATDDTLSDEAEYVMALAQRAPNSVNGSP